MFIYIINNIFTKITLVLLLLLFFLIIVNVKKANGYNCTATGNTGVCLVLQNIYSNTGGTSWPARCGWCNIFGSCPSGDCTTSGSWSDPCGVATAITRRWDGVDCLEISNNLVSLNLGFNSLIGSVPDLSGLSSTMKNLYLQDNQISNTDLATMNIHLLINLASFGIQNNRITGGLPGSLLGMRYLTQINIFNNELNQPFPTTITCAISCGLQTIRFNDNKIPGSLPTSLGSLTNLVGFYGYNNLFSGTFPNSFVNLTKLLFVNLSNNSFVGPLITRWESAIGVMHPLIDISLNPLNCLLPDEIVSYNHNLDLTNNAGFFCNPVTNIVIPPQVVGAGICVGVSLISVSPNEIYANLASTVVTIEGVNFNRCLNGWSLNLDGINQNVINVTSITPDAGNGYSNSQMIAILVNPNYLSNTAAVRVVGIYGKGSSTSRISNNLLSINYLKACGIQCNSTFSSHAIGCDLSGNCICENGYTTIVPPNYCVDKLCIDVCKNGGYCNYATGLCNCNITWSGADCSVRDYSALCPRGDDPITLEKNVHCCGNGICDIGTGACVCEAVIGVPWNTNTGCCTRNCPSNCNGNGFCNTTIGVCECTLGYSGYDCNLFCN